MKTLIELAVDFATEAHKGQTRWDKTPYINHPIAVMNLVLKEYKSSEYFILKEFEGVGHRYNVGSKELESYLAIIALFHDIAEDVKSYENDEDGIIDDFMFMAQGEFNLDRTILFSALQRLNKNYHNSYLDFILAAKGDFFSKMVKKADLMHNLSDLTKGSMKEKYELALYILDTR